MLAERELGKSISAATLPSPAKYFETGIPELDLTLEALLDWDGKSTFGLELPKQLMRALGDPQDKVRSIHVAGTNGKGSVCAYLASILHNAGYHVGQMASPHLVNVTERCLIDGRPVPVADFSLSVKRVMEVSAAEQINPSFFEVVAAASFLEFARRELDWMVVEVGLGGRLDATNTITRPEVCVISNIALDHTNVLGGTEALIAREKAGICKTGAPLFVGSVSEEAEAAIKDVAEKVASSATFWDSLRTALATVKDLNSPLLKNAPYQQENAALAVAVCEHLSIPLASIRAGIENARWPGRLERAVFQAGRALETEFLFDVAHNPDGMQSLAQFLLCELKENPPFKIRFLISALDRKDWRTMLDVLEQQVAAACERAGVAVEWVFTSSTHPHAVPAAELLSYYKHGLAFDDPRDAFSAILQADPKADKSKRILTVVTGSLYLVGYIRSLVVSEPFRTIA